MIKINFNLFLITDRKQLSGQTLITAVRKALKGPGDAKEDWQIICDICTAMGYPMQYSGPDKIMDQIASVTAIYGGISYDRIDSVGLQWPCPDKTHSGTRYLHTDSFKRGKGRFHAVKFREPAEKPDKQYPFIPI